jgi:hypothetical protein
MWRSHSSRASPTCESPPRALELERGFKLEPQLRRARRSSAARAPRRSGAGAWAWTLHSRRRGLPLELQMAGHTTPTRPSLPPPLGCRHAPQRPDLGTRGTHRRQDSRVGRRSADAATGLLISAGTGVDRDFNVLYERAAHGPCLRTGTLPGAHHTRAVGQHPQEHERRAFLDAALRCGHRRNAPRHLIAEEPPAAPSIRASRACRRARRRRRALGHPPPRSASRSSKARRARQAIGPDPLVRIGVHGHSARPGARPCSSRSCLATSPGPPPDRRSRASPSRRSPARPPSRATGIAPRRRGEPRREAWSPRWPGGLSAALPARGEPAAVEVRMDGGVEAGRVARVHGVAVAEDGQQAAAPIAWIRPAASA